MSDGAKKNMSLWKIHFGAKFDHVVAAASAEEVRRMAAEMATNPAKMLTWPREMFCSWITITPLGDPDEAGVTQGD